MQSPGGSQADEAKAAQWAFTPAVSWVIFVQSCLYFSQSILLETMRVLMVVVGEQLGLDPIQTAMTGSALPFGACLGAVLGGVLSDRYGRKPMMLVFLSGLVVTCCLAFVIPLTFSSIVTLHAVKGVSFGAVTAGVMPWGAEQYPAPERGRNIAFTAVGWSFGSIVTFALLQVPGVTSQIAMVEFMPAIPSLVCCGLLLMSEESPRWQMLKDSDSAGAWRLAEVFEAQGCELALMTCCWVCFSGGWYALFFWGPELLRRRAGAAEMDYAFFMWSAVINFPCFLVAAAVIERGRKPVFVVFCLLTAVCCVPLGTTGELECKMLLVVTDFFTCICWSAVAVLATETFPTVYRASALGWLSALARVAAGAMPLLGGFLFAAAPETVAFALAAAFGVSSAVVWVLPETAGLELRDGLGSRESSPLLGPRRADSRLSGSSAGGPLL